MKKYLFLVLSILSIFFITDRVEALSFTVNDKEVEVTEENLIYYIYSLYQDKFDSYENFVLLDRGSNDGYRLFFSNSEPYFQNGYFIGPSGSITCTISSDFNTISSFQTLSYNTSYTLNSNSVLFNNYSILIIGNPNTYIDSNITKQDLVDYFGIKYSINFYVDNNLYKTYEVKSNSSLDISQVEYSPPNNYKFNGWDLEGIDLSNITSDINIYGTTSYVRPDMNYSEDIDSVIHELSVSIIGKNVPVEFDYVYTIMDFIILIVLVLCVIAPFVILIRLLSGRW